jgi:hypothetical protein
MRIRRPLPCTHTRRTKSSRFSPTACKLKPISSQSRGLNSLQLRPWAPAAKVVSRRHRALLMRSHAGGQKSSRQSARGQQSARGTARTDEGSQIGGAKLPHEVRREIRCAMMLPVELCKPRRPWQCPLDLSDRSTRLFALRSGQRLS